MATVRVTVTGDDGDLVADYPIDNDELAECLRAAKSLRDFYYDQTGVYLEPTLEPEQA